MRFHPRHWSEELWACSIRGHTIPAADVGTIRPGIDDHLALEVGTLRLVRCIRCDSWVPRDAPQKAKFATMPAEDSFRKPRRGPLLEEAITMRIISVWRGMHAVVFVLIAIPLALVRTNLAGLKGTAASMIEKLDQTVTEAGRSGGSTFVLRNLEKVSKLKTSTLTALLAIVVFYAVLEGVEAIGLWRERRWAEYLTVVATALLIPIEIRELIKEVTAFRIGALIVNLAVVIFLIKSKRLFGYRGGVSHEEVIDWKTILHAPKTGREVVE